ncbi:MAG: hypothetical protein LBU32_09895 [Clostridiales bacterium]|jgi:predicted Fe-Mo cluster-binding NifX family protein|nr:hypothetical protein [Clostridiales bacterium]
MKKADFGIDAMKYRLAVGTTDGINVNEHFGRGKSFFIYEIQQETGESTLIERLAFEHGGDDCGQHSFESIAEKLFAFRNCQIVVAARIGGKSEKQLTLSRIVPLQFEGELETALQKIKKAYKHRIFESGGDLQ